MTPLVSRPLARVLRAFALVSRPMTLGVRLVALDGEGRVFLVRHAYRDGWYLPGGGVDPGETAGEAALREAREEGNLACDGPLSLVGVYYNRREGRDHVLLYRCDGARQTAPRAPDREIAEARFFPPDALPAEATPATRRRLDEVLKGAAPSGDW